MFSKTLKVTVSLLLAVLLLAGCGSTGTTQPQPTSAPTEGETQPEITAAPTEAATEPEATPAPTEEETQPAERPLALGILDGYTYTNAYTGYGCTLDDTWTIRSTEELQGVTGDIKDQLAGTQIEEFMDDYPQILDFSAVCAETLCTFNVNYTALSLKDRVQYALLSEEDIADMLLANMDLMVDTYKQMGIEVISMEQVKVTFLNEERFAVKTYAVTEGIDYYMLQLMDYHLGSYGVVLTAASYLVDNTQSVLDLFYAVD